MTLKYQENKLELYWQHFSNCLEINKNAVYWQYYKNCLEITKIAECDDQEFIELGKAANQWRLQKELVDKLKNEKI